MKRIQPRVIAGVTTLVLASLISACGTPGNGESTYGPSLTDADFGNSVRQARIRQTVDPDAGSKHGDGIQADGSSAVQAIRQYNKSFEQPRPTMNVLGIGGVGSQGN